MTLPSSGPLSMADINVELGRAASTPFSLNDSDVRALAGIPSGPIALSDFYGKSNTLVNLSGGSVSALKTTAGGFPQATYELRSNGTEWRTTNYPAVSSSLGTWLLVGSASEYEVRATLTSELPAGASGGNTFGVWQNCATTRTWSVSCSNTTDSAQFTFTLEIRKASTGAILDSAGISLKAEHT